MARWSLLLAALLCATPSWAQVLYGSLTGNVADPSKAAVPSAEVKLVNSLTGVAQKTQTDSQGVYRFNNIQSGTYEVECGAAGFRGYRRTGIEVAANEVVRVDVGLDRGDHAIGAGGGGEPAAANRQFRRPYGHGHEGADGPAGGRVPELPSRCWGWCRG